MSLSTLQYLSYPRETLPKGGTLTTFHHTYEVVVPASLYVCLALGTHPE